MLGVAPAAGELFQACGEAGGLSGGGAGCSTQVRL
jgi:hypothetical protein